MSSTVTANVADQNSTHDIIVMGQALYAVRTGDAAARTKALASLTSAIGTESGARWLAIGRNLGGYIIAADLLGVRSGPTFDWLKSFATRTLASNNSGDPVTMRQSAWVSGSNASAQEGFVSSALAVYLRDQGLLDWNWMAFRRYVGDRTSTHHITSNSDAWQMVPADPVGIQNKGAVKSGILLDGAISNDMSRGGGLVWPPSYTSYPWVGLEGSVPAAVVLSRQGYPAFSIVDSALRRAAEYLWAVRQASGNADWYDTSRAPEVKHILNDVYAFGLPEGPTGIGARTFSFTDWLAVP
jgi:hypothetical protein